MNIKSAIKSARSEQKISPRNLVGKERVDYLEWIKAFATGELDRKRSLHAAAMWVMQNTSVNCSIDCIKQNLITDSNEAANVSKEGDKSRKRKTKANSRRTANGVKKTKTS